MCAYDDSHNRQIASLGPWRAKIDYLSFTSPELHVFDNETGETYDDSGKYAVRACISAGLDVLAREGESVWSPASGRSGYSRSATHVSGARLFWSSSNAHPLIELGGAACDLVFSARTVSEMFFRHSEGVTRLDLAADCSCDVGPADFLAAGFTTRTLSLSAQDSPTGSTRYIGSAASDRRCRVYRYAPPHPRSDALRVEVVLRRDYAKEAALRLITEPVAGVFWSAAAPYEFRHPYWRIPSKDISPLKSVPHERTQAGRLRWLMTVVRDAAISAHRAGQIDLAEWLAASQGPQD